MPARLFGVFLITGQRRRSSRGLSSRAVSARVNASRESVNMKTRQREAVTANS